jgi:hypothetical protein
VNRTPVTTMTRLPSRRDERTERETQFYVELAYGLLFVGGFAFLAVRVDPRVAAFEGGLVVGYLLRVYEKMAIYERVLESAVSAEAESQVAEAVDDQVGDAVAEEVEDAVAAEVDAELDDAVEAEVQAELDDAVAEEVEAELDDAVADEVDAELDRRDIDGDGTETAADTAEAETDGAEAAEADGAESGEG